MEENPTKTKKTMSLRQKLFEIQKSLKTFATPCDSGKRGRDQYKYTPNYVVVESVREKLDELGVMIDKNFPEVHSQIVTRNIYKLIDGRVTPISVTENLVTVRGEYTFVDVQTGETIGPFVMTQQGTKEVDKSCSCALTSNEKYFLLKYFGITTRELEDEVDAQDNSNVPGLKDSEQPANIEPGGRMKPAVQAPAVTAAPMPAQPVIQAPPVQPAPQSEQILLTPEQTYLSAVKYLSMYAPGTPSYMSTRAKWLENLRNSGYDTSDVQFVARLENDAALTRSRQQ